MDLPTNPGVLAEACRFFDAYDAIPEEERLGAIRSIAEDLSIDFKTAFRWAVMTRPKAQAAGDPWPYYAEGETPADIRPTEFDALSQAERRAAKEAAEESEDAGEKIEDIKYGAQSDSLGDMLAVANIEALEEVEPVLRTESKSFYLKDRDAYLVFLSPRKPPIVVPATTHERMQSAYSNYDGHGVDVKDIAAQAGLTPQEFRQYKRIFGWTREMLPKTGVELAFMDEDEAVEEMAKLNETAIRQKWEQQRLRALERDAEKWRFLNTAILDRFEDTLLNIPQFSQKAPLIKLGEDPEFNLILPLNDWQVGSRAVEESLRFGRQFDKNVFRRMIDDYVAQLAAYIERQDVRWGTPYLVVLGDILHSMTGRTVHNTDISKHMDAFDWEQVEIALDALVRIADTVIDYFGTARLIGLPGNHEGYVATLLTKVLEQRYRSLGTVDAVLPGKRTHHELIGSSLFVFDHGASPDSNVKGGNIARSGPKRDVQIKDLVYTQPDLVAEARRRRGGIYFVMGDQHHTVDESAAGVELIKLPAMPSGDVYADENMWYSRPAQGLLLVGPDGLKHFERIYLDNARIFPEAA